MVTRQEALRYMLASLQEAGGVLTAGTIHADIPTIHDVGHREGVRLRSTVPIVHKGFGLFMGIAPDGNKFSFDGGGAMFRSDEDWPIGISWTDLRCSFETAKSMGYDRAKAKAALEQLLAEEVERGNQ